MIIYQKDLCLYYLRCTVNINHLLPFDLRSPLLFIHHFPLPSPLPFPLPSPHHSQHHSPLLSLQVRCRCLVLAPPTLTRLRLPRKLLQLHQCPRCPPHRRRPPHRLQQTPHLHRHPPHITFTSIIFNITYCLLDHLVNLMMMKYLGGSR